MTILLDSWIWLEFFLEGKKFEHCKQLLEDVRDGKEKVMMSTFVFAEVNYRLAKINEQAAHEQIHLMETFPHIEIIPVFVPIAKLAAKLRKKYYSKERPVSYGDMIHLATALLTGCTILYSGDPDFEGIEEIKTVIL